MKTDTTEKGLETLTMRHMTGTDGIASGASRFVAEPHRRKAGAAGSPGAQRPMTASLPWMFKDDAQLFKQFQDSTMPMSLATIGSSKRRPIRRFTP